MLSIHRMLQNTATLKLLMPKGIQPHQPHDSGQEHKLLRTFSPVQAIESAPIGLDGWFGRAKGPGQRLGVMSASPHFVRINSAALLLAPAEMNKIRTAKR